MNTEQAQTKTPMEEISLSVECRDGTKKTAMIFPVLLSARDVRGTVYWDETDPGFSIVGAESDGETPWGRRLLLVWCATGPQNTAQFPFLAADQWRAAVLSLPDFMGEKKDTVRVTVDARSWLATLEVTAQPNMNVEQEIPLELRRLDVGTVLAEVTSRLLLGHTWATCELTPRR